MQRICLFPGTFDPITMGHVDIIHRAVSLFDKLVIGIGINSSKAPMFSIEQRQNWMKEIFKDEPRPLYLLPQPKPLHQACMHLFNFGTPTQRPL